MLPKLLCCFSTMLLQDIDKTIGNLKTPKLNRKTGLRKRSVLFLKLETESHTKLEVNLEAHVKQDT